MSVATKAKTIGSAGVAALLVGAYVYARQTKAAEDALRAGPCANAPPGALQSLAQAIKGAGSNFLQDLAEGTLAGADLLVRLETFGLVRPDSSADFYAWWNNLTPEQRAQVRVTEDGNLTCALAETGSQLATGGSALTSAALAGVVAYLVASLVLEDA